MKVRYFGNRAAYNEPPVVVYGAGTLTGSVWMLPMQVLPELSGRMEMLRNMVSRLIAECDQNGELYGETAEKILHVLGTRGVR